MPPKNQDEARAAERANELAQKSESMARELSQKREMRIRQERVRHLSSDDAAKEAKPRTPPPRGGGSGGGSGRPQPSSTLADDKTIRAEDNGRPRPRPDFQQPSSPPFYPERKASMVDEVAVELEELLRDLRAGWRRLPGADKITFFAALLTLIGVLMPWLGHGKTFSLGITSGGAIHAALAATAVALIVGRSRRFDSRGERLAGRERQGRARRASLWHLLLGATSTLLCAYFLVVYGIQRSPESGLEIKYGLYVTLAAGMGLSYGGFARFWSHHEGEQR